MDPDVKRWHANAAQGSPITADVISGDFTHSEGRWHITQALLEMDPKTIYAHLSTS